jgi:peptidoglycan/xylan/chitin deacetylase (PgdA/CDA1 family)
VPDRLVLAYHAVSARWVSGLSVTPDLLEAHVRALLGRGYRPVTFAEAAASADDKVLAVTFDDGYASVHRHALGLLRRLGVPATLFVVTDAVGNDRPMTWPGIEHWSTDPALAEELRPCSWDELDELGNAGWEIGSHTRSHRRLTAADDATVADELAGSRRALEAGLGRACLSVAYPFGATDARVVAAADRAGYRYGTNLTVAGSGLLDQPRVDLYAADRGWRFRTKVSPVVRRLRAARIPAPGLQEPAVAV